MYQGHSGSLFPSATDPVAQGGRRALRPELLARATRLRVLFLLGFALWSASAATWTNLVGGPWGEPLNWSDHLVPAGTDAAISLPGTYVVTLGADTTVRQFLLDNPTATVAGAGTLTMSKGFTWRSGTLGGPASAVMVANGGLLLTGAAPGDRRSLARTLINAGAASWDDAATLVLAHGAVISNLAGGTFNLAGGGIVDAGGGNGLFLNAGVLRKTGSSFTEFGAELNNTGTVRIESGTLNLRQGILHSGSLEISNLAGLTLSGGAHTFVAGSTLTGAGRLTIAGGTATLGGLIDVSGDHVFSGGIANLTGRYLAISNLIAITGGTANFMGTGLVRPSSLVISNLGVLSGTSQVSVVGPMRWSAGQIRGGGLLVAEGGLELIGGALNLSGRTLVNRGAARWRVGPAGSIAPAGSLAMANGGVISNLAGASFEFDLDASVADNGGAGGFVNEGVFRKTGGTGNTVFSTPFRNTGRMELLSGTLRLQGGFTQTAGNLLLRGGNLASPSPLRILAGRLSGSGTVFGGISNAGWIQPGDGSGRMVLDGDYVQDYAGSCEVRLGGYLPGRDHDQLVISNTASLGGILVADLAQGFEPAPGAAFEILTCAYRTGTFYTFNYPSNTVGLALEYSISNVVVRVVNTHPVVDPIPDQFVDASGSLTVSVAARDADVPIQTLRYALTNAPAGATIDYQGVIRWTGAPTTPGSVASLTVVVTDNGTPNLSASRTFQVRAGAAPGPTAVSLQFGVPAAGSTTLTFRGTPGNRYHAEYSLHVLGPWFDLATATAAADGSWTVIDPNATNSVRFYRAW